MLRNIIMSCVVLLSVIGTHAANAAMFDVSGEASKKEVSHQQHNLTAASGERSDLALDRAAAMTSAFLRGGSNASKLAVGDVITLSADGLRYDDMPIMRDGRFFFSVIGTSFDYSVSGQF